MTPLLRTPAALICVLVGWALWPGGCGTAAAASPPAGPPSPPSADSARYLLIHLDGVSSEVFLGELEAGNLENLRAFFGDRGIIPHAVTYYPPFTSAVVKRMRHAGAIDEGEVIAWGVYDPTREANQGRARVLLRYARTVPRRARGNFLLGFPFMDHLAGLALWNAPEMVHRYGIMEYYWFGTDTAGHIWGEGAQRRNLRRFDRYFAGMASNLADDVNVVVYADHGMSFGEVLDYDGELAEFLGDRARHYNYPHVYLHDPGERAAVARDLVRRTWQDFAFYEEELDRIVGLAADGRFAFERRDGAIRYEHDGRDPLGYESLGYDGGYLEPEEWLALTHRGEFPYAAVRIPELFDNPFVGDVVVVLNDKPKTGPWVYAGNHHGLSARDMSVPVLVRGPELEHLYGREHAPIEEILERASPDSFEPRLPSREPHSAAFWVGDDGGAAVGGELVFSPAYRARLGLEAGPELDAHVWGAVDLLSGYLSRIWVGVGLRDDRDRRFRAHADYEFRVRRVGAELRVATAESTRLDLLYRLHPRVQLKLRDFEALGVRTRF